MTKSTAIVLFGIITEFALVMLIIWMIFEAWDYFHAYYDVLALAYGRG
jgi:hypothetical protein